MAWLERHIRLFFREVQLDNDVASPFNLYPKFLQFHDGIRLPLVVEVLPHRTEQYGNERGREKKPFQAELYFERHGQVLALGFLGFAANFRFGKPDLEFSKRGLGGICFSEGQESQLCGAGELQQVLVAHR